MLTISSLPTLDVFEAVCIIQANRLDDSNDVILDQVFSWGDVGIIALAAKRTGCFVTFTYVEENERGLKTIEVY